ncbi:serine/threonine protein kinase [Trichocoleus sp. FACHB-591]|uniref:serine/threonine protein kinase n=1 Tax=Trichocoleus sp. FACHB-591 TaxID=2692872 RepID=UPI001682A651|nr:serine/threonine-protein kinase [Trichocoleus sp. FACHB-591]MBD2096644.1 serine/threonine protein kinase [Trichocoleus sp. FACHB-591]
MDQLVNQVLCDRYRIQSLLGHQTNRRTFLAKDLQTWLPVVVKVLLFGPNFTWQDLKLFEREAEVLKSLNHSAIPKYLDYFDVETELSKGFALVQTYIEAKPLQDWVQSGRTFSEAELKAIAKELLGILDYLHSRQPAVVHRDIKPSNILLGDRSGHSPGQIYLIDFGSVQTAVRDGTKTIVGTYGYMPLEQFGGQTTLASDLYALGATLIYLATGQHPDQLPQRKMQIHFEDRSNLSLPLRNWLKWMTEPNVELRLKSAKQALETLEISALLRHPSSTGTEKPAGSKVEVINTDQILEILIPPRWFHWGLLPMIGFAIPWNSFLVLWYSTSLATWSSGGWFSALFCIGHLGIGLWLTWNILFSLLGQVRLRINQSEILLVCEFLGLRCTPPLTYARQKIMKIEVAHLFYNTDLEGDSATVFPQITIWAGTRKFQLGDRGSLTNPEIDWLAQELSNWLDIPITQLNAADSAKK